MNSTPKKADPTPEEIREKCLEIQSGWTPTQERSRRGGLTEAESAVQIPVIVLPNFEFPREWRT